MIRIVAPALALLGAVAASSIQSPARPADVDAAFASFFNANTPDEIAAASNRIAASGVAFDDAFRRLKAGRVYARDVSRGVVQGSYRSGGVEYYYTLEVPETYDPARKYQARVQLHGGVGRIETSAPPRAAAAGRLAGAEQIYVMPYAWRDAPWWSRRQIENLSAILDRVKRTYNVDENRVVLSGVSDGGTAAYYVAMRETTPFASFLPLNGFIMVLRNETDEADGDLFPNNLVNKPLFIVNGGRDPIYPASVVAPLVDHLKNGGVTLVYRPQAEAAHDTSWWPQVKDEFEQFVAAHPRTPLPDRLSWESGIVPSRAHWLVIDRLGPRGADDPDLPDVNARATPAAAEFGIRSAGTRLNRVLTGSNAQQIGLRSGDIVTSINNQPLTGGADIAGMLRDFPPGRPLLLTVTRGDRAMRLTGRYAPAVVAGEATMMFPPAAPSGRVDLVRAGNRVEARTRGVAAFTLLLSPDQFDFSRPVTVVVNGRTAFDGMVQKSVKTLATWAARDNDRTMLFAAELPIAAKN